MEFTHYYYLYEENINEMPHTGLEIDGFSFDYQVEKGNWLNRFVDFAKKLSNENIDKLLEPLTAIYNVFFVKKMYGPLNYGERQKFKSIVTNNFKEYMNLDKFEEGEAIADAVGVEFRGWQFHPNKSRGAFVFHDKKSENTFYAKNLEDAQERLADTQHKFVGA